MNLLDVVFLGWYHILDKMIYWQKADTLGFGPREHSFFITFLIHGINIWTIVRFILAEYFLTTASLYASLSIGLIVFIVGYMVYIRGKRAYQIINMNVNRGRIILFVFFSIIYVTLSVYLMWEVGNFARSQSNC